MGKFMQQFLAGLGLVAIFAAPAHTQSSCQTNADTAAIHSRMVTQIVTYTDSVTLVSQGLWYKPTGGIALVTDSKTCSKAVAALNALVPANDPRRISKAYVFKIGNKGYAAVGEKTTSMYDLFDTKFKILASMGAMD